ncbi:hypothetical protein HID58_093496 [Brassica napus]|uniref:Glycosyl hydrolase family 13 catalytic domain-containing protein n=1 Tax=Brassica napus TaxID=3708 RepID=A0ABQ7XAP8_BRANA|nr:hypothetical protein HID58_093496 [Brassica napus]
MVSLSNQTSFSFYPNNLFVSDKTRLGIPGINFPRKIKVKVTCFAADQPRQQKQQKKKKSQSTNSDADSGVDPVGFLTKLGIADRIFAQFLRERHKAIKDLKDELLKRHFDLRDLASGLLGMHRHMEHRVDFIDWGPGARYGAIIGDFNGWSPTENSAREGLFGHDDFGYWFIILKISEEPEELYFQQYNYVDDYDKGDSGVTAEEVFQRANDEYWEPGEDRFIKNRYEVPAKLYEQLFGPNSPQTLEDLGEIPDAETRYKQYKEEHKNDPPSNLPPCDIIDDVTSDSVLVRDARKEGRRGWKSTFLLFHMEASIDCISTLLMDRLKGACWATYVQQDEGKQAYAIHWEPSPESAYKWKHSKPDKPKSLRIYECHVGISGSEAKISSFEDFTKKASSCEKSRIQCNPVDWYPEHKDYYTVGYRVTNFFAVSSRYGTPDDFKRLVDEAHGLGLLVFLDIVQSYAAADQMVGLSLLMVQTIAIFIMVKGGITNTGAHGCSNTATWMFSFSHFKSELYQVDGYQFHSLASMIYTHNGFAPFNSGFDECSDVPHLANEILHDLHPDIITIAEDATYYPGLCEPVSQGGLGFDYYVNLSATEMWVSLLDTVPDSEWSMSKIVSTLVANKEYADKMLSYAESHKPIQNEIKLLDRGVSLHKMIRLLTFTIGGRAYLNFMGNEFGHPERVEFPTQSNKFSFSLANRRWDCWKVESIISDLMDLDKSKGILSRGLPSIHHVNDANMYGVGVEEEGEYTMILNSDEAKWGSGTSKGGPVSSPVYKLTRILRI